MHFTYVVVHTRHVSFIVYSKVLRTKRYIIVILIHIMI